MVVMGAGAAFPSSVEQIIALKKNVHMTFNGIIYALAKKYSF